MTPNQLAEKWLLDPQGGGWPYDPETRPSAPFYFQHVLRFRDQKKSYVAGYEAGKIVAHEEIAALKAQVSDLKTQLKLLTKPYVQMPG